MRKGLKYNILAILSLSFIFASCSEDTMDGINDYDGYPKEVQLQFRLPALITSTAFSSVGGDLSTYASIYIEHEGGVYNQTYNAETRVGDPTSTSTYNNNWEQAYRNIAAAKSMIKDATTGTEAGSKVQEGMARLLLAYNSALVTDLFGDAAYFQAGITDDKGIPVYKKPAFDKQEDIYNDIFAQLDTAILLLETNQVGPIGLTAANDFIYNGSTSDWIKAAYGLKARYTMRLLGRSSNQTESLNNVIAYADKSFQSASDEFAYSIYNGTSQQNPLAAFTYSRAALGASKSFVDKLKERNDPRYTQMFVSAYNSKDTLSYITINDPAKLVLVTNGVNIQQSNTYYSCNITDIAASASTLLMSYHELLFLKAEAYARLGKNTEAESALESAITAGFQNLSKSIQSAVQFNTNTKTPQNFDLSASVSQKYYEDNVKALFTANPLKEIMIQKYLAMNGANGESIETYNDIRRMQGLNENFVTLANPLNAQGKFPYRYVYGSSTTTVNDAVDAIVGDGTYVYTSKVWWAGGSN